MVRFLSALSLSAMLLVGTRTVSAQTAAPPAAPPVVPAAAEPAAAPAPAPASAPPAPIDDSTGSNSGGVPMVDASVQDAAAARYGLGVRARWTSVPKWMLGLFLNQSVPLSSYTIGAEGFRRTGNFDFVLGLAWQSLSPPDGNWLGKGNPSSTDTDYVQFKGLGAVSVDAAFILHSEFNEYVGMHYGGGVGLGIITGRMLRTSNGSGGCVGNAGSVEDCHPVVCPTGPCTEGQLLATEGGQDSAGTPSRFEEKRVPSIYPIVNVITGLDVRVPSIPDMAFKIDVGYFFPYFFVGGGVAYRL